MATAKRYYWLKLKEDFFEDDTIEWIEEQPNGEKYSLFYLKLCLKSLKTNGILIRNVGEMLIPYDVKKLAEITKTDVDTVRVAMELFKNIGLIQILENGEIYLAQLQNMVGSESKWAEKKRLQRAQKAKELPKPPDEEGEDSEGTMSSNCPIEIEKEKEKEKEKDLEKELTDRQRERESEGTPLTDAQMERVELLRELFVGWSVSDYQIYYLSTLMREQIPYDPYEGVHGMELKIYHEMEKLILQARADKVTYIYRWLIKMIPLAEIY